MHCSDSLPKAPRRLNEENTKEKVDICSDRENCHLNICAKIIRSVVQQELPRRYLCSCIEQWMVCKEWITLIAVNTAPVCSTHTFHNANRCLIYAPRKACCTPRHGPTAGPWGLGWPHHRLRLAPLSPSAPARQLEPRWLCYNSLWNLLCYVISPLLYYGGKKNKLLRMLVSNCNNFPWTG